VAATYFPYSLKLLVMWLWS